MDGEKEDVFNKIFYVGFYTTLPDKTFSASAA